MTPLDRGPNLAPAPQTVAILRERLQRLGFSVSDAAARSLVEAVLEIERPRLLLQVRGTFENSLEIIRDTAESALGGADRRVERSELLGGARRPAAARPPLQPPPEEVDEDEPRPVFKRPRR